MNTNFTPEALPFNLARLMILTCNRLNSEQIQCIPHSDQQLTLDNIDTYSIEKAKKAFEEGLSPCENLSIRSQEAHSYQPLLEEKESMERLILHRETLHSYSDLIENCRTEEVAEEKKLTDALINTIQQHIDELANPNSKKILFDGQGRSMFCLPGGTFEHTICYEFAREADSSYSFLIYNKGEGSNYAPFHGDIEINKRGLDAGRTRVQIKNLNADHLKDSKFLRVLISKQNDPNSTMTELYNLIRSHLITRAGGFVLVSPEEKEVSAGRHEKSLKEELLKNPDYHRLQTWGTCSESNFQTPERFLIDPLLRKKLKLYAIQCTVKTLGEQVLRNNPRLDIQTKAKMQSLREQIYKTQSQKFHPRLVYP